MKPIVATLLTAAALSVACSSYDSHSAPQAERISFSIAASADMSRTQWGECEEGAYAVKVAAGRPHTRHALVGR